jgi:hypothetical protein
MSLFGKQDEQPSPSHVTGQGGYGIADLIRLLKVIPTDHHPQLVVQVIKTTLESVGVMSSAVIEDAFVQENGIRDAIEMLESQIVVLRQEIQARQEQIVQLDVALRETIGAKNLLVDAETPSGAPSEIDLNQAQFIEASDAGALHGVGPDETGSARSLPPPLPPPRRKTGSGPVQPSQVR